MAQAKNLTSNHFPYLPIEVTLKENNQNLEALLDTGFDGYVILPPKSVTNGKLPDLYTNCTLANNLTVRAPVFIGSLKLGVKKFSNILIIIMGDEPIIGRGISNNFKITLDHGKRVIVE